MDPMWLIHFLPDGFIEWVVNGILVTGLVGSVLFFVVLNPVLRFLPWLSTYYRLLQIISLILLVLGVYFRGGYSVEKIWREQSAEMQARIAKAEEDARNATGVIEEKIVYKTKLVKEQSAAIVQYVDREIVKYDSTCVIPKEVVDAHNAAALNKPINEVQK